MKPTVGAGPFRHLPCGADDAAAEEAHQASRDLMPTRLHLVLQNRRITDTARLLRRRGLYNEKEFRDELDYLGLPPETLAYLNSAPWDEIDRGLDTEAADG